MQRSILLLAGVLVGTNVCWADFVGPVKLVLHGHDHAYQSELAEGRGSWRLFGRTRSVVAGEIVEDFHSSTGWVNYRDEADSNVLVFNPSLEVPSYPCTVELDLTFWEGSYPHFYELGHSVERSFVVWEPGIYTLNLAGPPDAPDLRATLQLEVYASWLCRARRCVGSSGARYTALLSCGESDGVWVAKREPDELGPGYRLNEFTERWENLSADGYRLVDAEVYSSWAAGDAPFFLGRFERGEWDHAFYVDLSLGDVLELASFLHGEGYLLIDLESYQQQISRRFLAVFRRAPGPQLVRYGRWDEFADDWSTNTTDSRLRLTEVETFIDDFGARLFIGVYHDHGGAHGLHGGTWAAFSDTYEQSTNPGPLFQGVPLVDLESYPYQGGHAFFGAYLQREDPAQTMLVGQDHDQFFERVLELERNGWKVDDFDFASGAFPEPVEHSGRCIAAEPHEPLDIYPLFATPPQDPEWERPVVVGVAQRNGRIELRLDGVHDRPEDYVAAAYFREITLTERPFDLGNITSETIEIRCDDLPVSEGMLCVWAGIFRAGIATEPSCVYVRCVPPHIETFAVVDDQILIELSEPAPTLCTALEMSILTRDGEEVESFDVEGLSFALDRSELPISSGYIELTCRARSGAETSARREFSFEPDCSELVLDVGPLGAGVVVDWGDTRADCSTESYLIFTAPNGDEQSYRVTGAQGFEIQCDELPAPSGEVCLSERRPGGEVVETCAPYVCPGAEAGQVLFDCNQDGGGDISDAVCVFSYLFLGIRELPCSSDDGNRQLLDWNGDTTVDISDAISAISYYFLGGPPHHHAQMVGGDPEGCFPISGCPPGPCGN